MWVDRTIKGSLQCIFQNLEYTITPKAGGLLMASYDVSEYGSPVYLMVFCGSLIIGKQCKDCNTWGLIQSEGKKRINARFG